MKTKPVTVQVPFFDLKKQYRNYRSEINKTLTKVLAGGHFILGSHVQEFEEKIAKSSKVKFAIGVASGSDALWLSLLALGIGPGDEVITTPYTFIATASSILKVGARPVFVDIDPETFCIDPGRVRGAITPKTKAIIPVHLFGLCAAMSELLTLAKENNLRVIEDAAQSQGALCQANPAGSMGDAGILSFFPSKNLGGLGDGGMVVTQREEIFKKIRMLRVHGASRKYFHEVLGWNSRLDAMQAAVLSVKLGKLGLFIRSRQRTAKKYYKLLRDLPLKLPIVPEGFTHTYNQFVIRTEKRDALKAFLAERGVGTEIYYPMPLHLQPCFSSLGYKKGDFPHSELLAEQSLALPIFPEITDRQIEYVVKNMIQFFEGC